MNSMNLNAGAKNVKLLGNGTPGLQYGIKINGANNFATYWKATGEIEIAYVEVVGTAAGIEVKHPPGEAYTQNFANVKIHDNYIHDHRLEGMYIGMDNLALDVLINAEIYNNIVRNSGNDGIQTRNGTFNIHDNIVDNVAVSPAFPYDINGILVGGNTKDSIIRNNTVSRVPGTAIFNNGWGNHTIACNVISSTQPGIFTKNYEFATEDLQDVGFQNFNIQNNTITSTSGIALQTYYSSNGSTTTTNFSNNKTTGSVDANYTVTQSNNTGSVVPNCSTTPPPTNSAPTANAGTDRSITLPTSSVTLSGSGTDSDGSITSYAWTKVSGGSATITTPSSASTTVTGLSAGSYTFRLTVTDDDGATDTDDMVVVVNPEPVGVCSIPQKIVILGSSTAAGNAASSYQNSWAGRLATYAQSQNPGGQIINLGMSTYTTYHILATGSSVPSDRPTPDTARNITRALSYAPDAIVINMPTNDAANGYTLAEQQANFVSLAQIAADAGVELWVTTTQPRNLSSSQRTQLITMRDWIYQQFGVKAVDFWTTVANSDGTINSVYNSGDGIHLNDAGHLVLYNSVLSENIYDTLCTTNPNTPPVAVAGADQSITLPISYLTLSGSGTDSDGSITSYAWTRYQVQRTITGASSASTVTGLRWFIHLPPYSDGR
jgi:lysophospholipase L1-like esterase